MNTTAVCALAHGYIKQNLIHVDRFTLVFFWPVIFLILFGYIGKTISTDSPYNAQEVLVFGAICEGLTLRISVLLARNVYEEVKSKSLPNLFSTPLTLSEWICALIAYTLAIFMILFVLLTMLSYALFAFNIFNMGVTLLFVLVQLFIGAIAFGFLGSCFIIRFGQRTLIYAFMLTATVTPLSGFFYDIQVMPLFMQYVAMCIPIYYIALQAKMVLIGTMPTLSDMLFLCCLNIAYLVIAVLVFADMFEKSRSNGFA